MKLTPIKNCLDCLAQPRLFFHLLEDSIHAIQQESHSLGADSLDIFMSNLDAYVRHVRLADKLAIDLTSLLQQNANFPVAGGRLLTGGLKCHLNHRMILLYLLPYIVEEKAAERRQEQFEKRIVFQRGEGLAVEFMHHPGARSAEEAILVHLLPERVN